MRTYQKLLFFFSTLLFFHAGYSQTYRPSAHVQVNDAVAPAQATPLEARSMFYDTVNFLYRAYQSTAEVLSYLNTTASRSGNFIIIVDSGGTLQSNGTYLNPHNTYYMFADSTTSGGLKKMNLFGAGSGSCSGCLLAANNLSDLGNLSTALANINLNNVDNTSDATKNAASVSLTNHTIDGSLNTLLNIPNSALSHSTIGLSVTSSAGSDITVTTTPASLGSSLVVNMPTAGTSSRGPLASTDWNFFNGKLDSVHISNDSVYNCVNGVCTLSTVLSGSGSVNSVNATNASLLFSPSTGNVLGQVNPAYAFNWTGQHTFTSFAPIFSTLTTAGGFFYGDGFGQLLQTTATPNTLLGHDNSGNPADVAILAPLALVSNQLSADTALGDLNLATQNFVTRNTANSVSNADTTLTIAPTRGNVVASLNIGHKNFWTAAQAIGVSSSYVSDTIRNVGTSYTAGVGASNTNSDFSTIADFLMQATQDNHGIPSLTLQNDAPTNPWGAATNGVADTVNIPTWNSKRRLAILEYGINDYRWIGTNWDTVHFKAEYREVIQAYLNRGWSLSQLVLLTPIVLNQGQFNTDSAAHSFPSACTPARALTYVDAIKKLGTEFGVKVVDVNAVISQFPVGLLLSSDSIHLGNQGQLIYAQTMVRAIGYNIVKQNQQFAVNGGLTEVDSLKIRQLGSTVSQTVTPLVADSSANIYGCPNCFAINNPPQSQPFYLNTSLGVTSAFSTPKYLVVTGTRSATGVGGISMNTVGLHFEASSGSGIGFIDYYNYNTNTAGTVNIGYKGGNMTVGSNASVVNSAQLSISGGLNVSGTVWLGATNATTGVRVLNNYFDAMSSTVDMNFRTDAASLYTMALFHTGRAMSGSSVDEGTAQFQALSTTLPQFAGYYDGTHYFKAQANSSGNLTVTATGGNITMAGVQNFSSYGSGTNTGTGTYNLAVTSAGKVIETPLGIGSYQHTIFTPLTGATINLVNNQYNIINPAGTLATLTVNLPSSPANNDVVYIKYTQAITAVTYGNGTVVDGITSPVAGGLVVLTYDTSTTSWY